TMRTVCRPTAWRCRLRQEAFRNLDGGERRAHAELVAGDEEAPAPVEGFAAANDCFLGRIGADAADEDVVAAGGLERRGEGVAGAVVDDPQGLAGGEGIADLPLGGGGLERDVD